MPVEEGKDLNVCSFFQGFYMLDFILMKDTLTGRSCSSWKKKNQKKFEGI